jgi:enamine deaminase RidA (YjgF/YER057c/UK114 family)
MRPLRIFAFLLALCAAARAADPYAPLAAMLPGRAHFFLEALAAPDAGPDLDAQSAAVLARLDRRLKSAGLARESLVYLHAYVIAPADAARWHERLLVFLPHPPHHTRETVVPALAPAGAVVLLECLAAYPADFHPTVGARGANPGLSTLRDDGQLAGLVVQTETRLNTVNNRTAFGDTTAAQAAAIFGQLRVELNDRKLTLADVAQLRVTLAPDGRAPDLAGWGKAFARYFRDATPSHQPALTLLLGPARADDYFLAVDCVVAARNAQPRAQP